MHYLRQTRSILLLVAVALLMTGHAPVSRAQVATPVLTTDGVGVVFTPLAVGRTDAFPPAPATLVLVRAEFEPGGGFLVDPSDPNLRIITVESGELTLRLNAPVTISRAGAMGTLGAMEQASEFTLRPGDSFVFPSFVGGELRNTGHQETVILGVRMVPDALATPVP